MREEQRNPNDAWRIGQAIQITAGPFIGMKGVIRQFDPKEQSTRVEVDVFNRQNFVEVPFSSLKALDRE